jgi:PAS domain S-box-containing protein
MAEYRMKIVELDESSSNQQVGFLLGEVSPVNDVINSLSQPIVAFDRKFYITAINKSFHEIFFLWTGLRLYVGMNYLEVIPKEILSERLNQYRKVFSGEKLSIQQDYNLAGEVRTFLVSYDPIYEKGEVVGIICSGTDITTQKQTEAELRNNERRLLDLVKVAPVGICQMDTLGTLTYVNDRWCEIVGVNEKQARGSSWLEMVHPDDRLMAKNVWEESAELSDVHPIEFRVLRAKGEPAWVLSKKIRLRNENGAFIGYLGALQDISKRKLAEEGRLRMIEIQKETVAELARSNKELEQFAYIASHDLQEPLRMIVSYLQFLDLEYRTKLSAEADEYLHFATDGAKRMSQLIKDLLAYSKVGREEIKSQRISANEILRETIAQMGESIKQAGVSFDIQDLPNIFADESQMFRLFQNILGNAIKYRSSRPLHISISAEHAGNKWIFKIKDNGIGFDMGEERRIFRLFQRLHARDQYPGGGIGLAISKSIVERHGGEIWAESKIGIGSSFYFSIPDKPLISNRAPPL